MTTTPREDGYSPDLWPSDDSTDALDLVVRRLLTVAAVPPVPLDPAPLDAAISRLSAELLALLGLAPHDVPDLPERIAGRARDPVRTSAPPLAEPRFPSAAEWLAEEFPLSVQATASRSPQ